MTKQQQSIRLTYAQEAWDAIRLAIAAVNTHQPLNLANKHQMRAAEGIEGLRYWLITSALSRGIDQTTKDLKLLTDYHRAKALNLEASKPPLLKFIKGELKSNLQVSRYAEQFSRLGRALPQPSAHKIKVELAKHKERFTCKTPPTNPDILEELTAFTYRLYKPFAKTIDEKLVSHRRISTSKSASFWETVLKGGQAADLLHLLIDELGTKTYERIKTLISLKDHKDLPEIDEMFQSGYLEQAFLNPWAKAIQLDAIKMKQVFMKAVGLPELGGKVRVVASPPASLVAIGNFIREAIMIPLDNHQQVDNGNDTDDKIKNFNKLANRGATYYSGDLTTATDYFPHDVANAITEGIMAALPHDYPDVRHILNKLTNETVISYPDGSTIKSKAGIHMGLPISFTYLTIANLFCARPNNESYLIRGDDLGAQWTRNEIQRYEDRLTALNLKTNKTKSYRSDEGLTFAERTYQVSRTNGVKQLVRMNVLPLRRLIPRDDDKRTKGKIQENYLMKIGPRITEVFQASQPDRRIYRPVAKALLSIHRNAVAAFRGVGIPLFTPRILGGAGFIDPRGYRKGIQSAPTRFRLAAEVILTQQDNLTNRLIGPYSITLKRTKEVQKYLRKREAKLASSGKLGRAFPVLTDKAIANYKAYYDLLDIASGNFAQENQSLRLKKVKSNLETTITRLIKKYRPAGRYLYSGHQGYEGLLQAIDLIRGADFTYMEQQPILSLIGRKDIAASAAL